MHELMGFVRDDLHLFLNLPSDCGAASMEWLCVVTCAVLKLRKLTKWDVFESATCSKLQRC